MLQVTIQLIENNKLNVGERFNSNLLMLASKCKEFLLSSQLKTQKDFYNEFNISPSFYKSNITTAEDFIIYNVFKAFPPYVLYKIFENKNDVTLNLNYSTQTFTFYKLNIKALYTMRDV